MDVDHRPTKAVLKDRQVTEKGAKDVVMGGSGRGSPTPWGVVEEGVSLMDIDDGDEGSKSDTPNTTTTQTKRQTRHGRR